MNPIRALKKYEKEKIRPLIKNVFPDAEFSIKNSDEIFVYEKNLVPVAFAHLREYRAGIVLLGLGVLKDFRSQGIGKNLLSSVLAHAEKFHKPIYLKVKKTNHAAISLYKTFGFKITKSKKDRFVMKRACFS